MITNLVRIAFALGVALVLSACPSKNSNQPPPPPQKSGGGVDSSGGDALKSTPEQVDEALKDIEKKTLNALFRSVLIYTTTNRMGVDKAYGIGIYDLLESLISGNQFKVAGAGTNLVREKIRFRIERDNGCLSNNHENKAGSATGRNGEGEICLSAFELRKVSPTALQVEAIALAMHELGHLYGMSEIQAVQLQKFFAKHVKFTHIDPVFRKQMHDMFQSVENGFAVMYEALSEKNPQMVCMGMGQLRSNITAFISIYNGNEGSVVNGGEFFENLVRSLQALNLSGGFCTGRKADQFEIMAGKIHDLIPVDKGNWQQLHNNWEGMVFPFFTARHLFTLIEDPAADQAVSGISNIVTAILESLIDEEGVGNRKDVAEQIANFNAETQIHCRDGFIREDHGKKKVQWNNWVIRPRKIYSGKEGTLYNLDGLMGGNVMVRMRGRMRGGVSLTTMIEGLQEGAAKGGVVAHINEAKSQIQLISVLAAGLNERVEMTIRDPKTQEYRTAVCRYSTTPLKPQDLETEHPQMGVRLALRFDDIGKKFETDKTFYKAAQGTLHIYGGDTDKRSGRFTRGELLKTMPIVAVGSRPGENEVTFFAAAGSLETKCQIVKELADEKKLDSSAIANKAANGAKLVVKCFKNAETDRLHLHMPNARDVEISE